MIHGDEEGPVATFQIYTPPAPLSAYVEFFWLHEEHAQPHALERALPTGKPAMWIELGGDPLQVATQQHPHCLTTFRTSTLLGASSRWHVVAAGRHIARMGVLFTPGGAAAFFAQPASELHDMTVPLDALWGDSIASEFRERLFAVSTPEARFRALERALLARCAHTTNQHPAVAFALRALHRAPQARTIAQVAEQIALSHRQLVRAFHSEVGMTPKRFARVRRFQEVLDRVGCERHVNWGEIALACGYADQAHLTRDFHEFAGVSPTAYLHVRDPRSPTYFPYVPDAPDTISDRSITELQAPV
jgi:methylphosphotriester-DNA--protein-cysteine methyltransferase